MTKIYAMEKAYMTRLLSERKEIMSLVKGWSAEDMRSERAALIESCQAYVTPTKPEDIAKSYTVDDAGVAHIPIVGQLTPKAETDACGAYTAEALTEYGFIAAASQAADNDEYVTSIEYYIDSPGGYVSGLMPAVKAMRDVSKPTSAVVGGMAASAGYWLASQTDRIIASSDITRFGSIGVAVEEYDDTQMLENAGITRRVYTSTDAPLKRPDTKTEEGQMEVIQGLDDLHAVFAGQVAEGRHTDVMNVNAHFGRGAVFTAQEAMRRGMIDEIQTMTTRNKVEKVQDVILSDTAAKAEEKEQEVKSMTFDDLRKEHSAVYEEAVQAGVKQERERRNAIADIMKADADNADLKTVCDTAVQEGTAADDMAFKISVMKAVQSGAKLEGENAPTVETEKDVVTAALTEEEKTLCKNLGLTEESYLTQKDKEVI